MRTLLTVKQASQRLGLKEPTLRRMVFEQRIDYVRVGRRAIRIPLDVIEKIIEDGTRRAR